MIVTIDILVVVASILSNAFVNSLDIASILAYVVVIAKLSIVILHLKKSFAKRLLLNETIVYDFENDVARILRKTIKIFLTL